jgi:hypothetical protein
MNFEIDFEIIIIFIIVYYNIVIWVVKLFRVKSTIISTILNMSTLYFHKISFRYFEDYLMMKLLTLG